MKDVDEAKCLLHQLDPLVRRTPDVGRKTTRHKGDIVLAMAPIAVLVSRLGYPLFQTLAVKISLLAVAQITRKRQAFLRFILRIKTKAAY